MKTTIDLPDALLHQAKIAAARRRTTLKNLVVEGLELVIHAPSGVRLPAFIAPQDEQFFEMDSYGVSVLKRRGIKVTDSLIERIREEEGI